MQTRLINLQTETLRSWCLFADPLATRQLDHGVFHLLPPDFYVGLSRQRLNEHGIVQWETFIFRTVAPGESYQDLPLVTPGGDLLCYTSGKSHAQTVKEYVAKIEETGIEPAHAGTLHRRAAPYLQHNHLPTRLIRDYADDRGPRRELS
jgi:hypothetical protein